MASEVKLNKEQKTAVEHGEGPLLIIAGAGTGKTAVITERVKYLISKGVNPEEILALTFTEKAANEMQERIDVALTLSYGEMWIMTFHGFCDAILRESAIHIGLPPNYKLTTQAQSIDLVKKNLFEFDLNYFRPLGNPNKFIAGMLSHFSRLQDEVVLPSDYVRWAKKINGKKKNDKLTSEKILEDKKWKELAKAYHYYDELKIKEGKFDFGDLIIKTIELFKKRPNILTVYQNKFKYILVDEFQDTNFAQNELLKFLAGKNGNITVVGDDDQSVYKFRGAAISNLIQFRITYPKAKVVVLTKNYRSTQKILDSAYSLIQHNNPERLEVVENINKKLTAENSKSKTEVKFIHTNKVDEEAEEVSKSINQLVNQPASEAGKLGYKYSDIAILVRANNHADPFIRELEYMGIPYQFLGPSKLFEKVEVSDLISYLRVLYNVFDNGSFYRLLTSEIFDLTTIDILKITQYAKKNTISIYETLLTGIEPKTDELLEIIKKHQSLINTDTAGHLLLNYVNDIGIYQKIMDEKDETKIQNIGKFFDKIKAYEYESKDASVFAAVDYIDLLLEVGEGPFVTDGDWQANNAVNILTVHSAKGLEFPVVFLVNLVTERFPSRSRSEQIPIPDELIKEVLPVGDFHLQEERRLFYVGMTRACERLYLTASDYYGDGKRKKKISPFVFETLGNLPNDQSLITNNITISKLQFNNKTTNHTSSTTHNPLKINTLSVSQIEAFDICPLHYKLKYIYKLPTETTASISFGVTMHCTMRDFYISVKAGKNPTNNLIIKAYKENWIGQGFENKKQKELYFKRGEKYLTEYLTEKFNKNIIPEKMEEKFKINLGNNFNIIGTFDRVDVLRDGKIEIIDYKTGESIPTQKDADRDLQLGVYGLAVTKIKSEVFNKKPEDIKLSLYYFEGQQKIQTSRTARQLQELEKLLFEKREEIQNSDFRCSNHYFCQNKCEFSMFCKSEN